MPLSEYDRHVEDARTHLNNADGCEEERWQYASLMAAQAHATLAQAAATEELAHHTARLVEVTEGT